MIGQPFVEGAGMKMQDWMVRRRPLDEDGNEIGVESLPIGMTMLKREPAHGVARFRREDGAYFRFENVTFPLFAHTEDFVGVMAMAWTVDEDRP